MNIKIKITIAGKTIFTSNFRSVLLAIMTLEYFQLEEDVRGQ